MEKLTKELRKLAEQGWLANVILVVLVIVLFNCLAQQNRLMDKIKTDYSSQGVAELKTTLEKQTTYLNNYDKLMASVLQDMLSLKIPKVKEIMDKHGVRISEKQSQ